ncbi:hypothetical protein [Candidatus Poriferisocius sp.]|uniref:hypothetical protein n=1 Tax=Candidatus Poriferisocius sp. TaxID=3101276 RepID=UPI003B02C29E
MSVELEGSPWWNPIDDDDALVFWEPIQGATQYQLDWRYIEIDTDALRRVYNRLESGGLSSGQAQQYSGRAAELLEGEEVRASRISGDSRPASSGHPEINFNVNIRTYQDTRPNPDKVDNWNPDRTEFRIHSNQKQYVLQARVRAHGYGLTGSAADTWWQTNWSDWVYHPSSKLTAGCQAIQVYNTIEDVKKAIDAANLILTIGGIAGAIFTGGTSVMATQGAKAAIIIAAKQIVKKVLFDYSLKKFILTLIKEMGKAIAARAAVDVLAFVFNCVTHAIDTDNWSAENAKELGAEMIREFLAAENLSSTIDRDKVLQEWAKANVL